MEEQTFSSDIQQFFESVGSIFETEPKLVAVYVVVYLLWGVAMNQFGIVPGLLNSNIAGRLSPAMLCIWCRSLYY